ncbi:hypothetical protein PVK06_039923 [Gossypium arboreum]|uniref:Uncharacterized protein n=1 Tax=Gossypium arboreum TaxID=29729 RepID=A0ABR0N456_GOSAR|nr:hypothetical protein PVK06_039923 [Gossypium arboreum]
MADIGALSTELGNIRLNRGAFLKNLKGRGLKLRNGLLARGKLDEGNGSESHFLGFEFKWRNGISAKNLTAPISLPKDKATSLHGNPTFEGRHGVKVNLISKVLDPKRHTIVTFKENLDNNSKSKIEKRLLMVHRDPFSISRGYGVESRKGRGHNGKLIIKSIRRRGVRFKPVGSSRVSLLEAMGFMAEFFSTEVEISSNKSDVKVGSAEASATL